MIFEARLFWAAVIDKLDTYFQSYFQAFNKIMFEKILENWKKAFSLNCCI